MNLREELKKNSANRVSLEEWDNLFLERCIAASKSNKNREIFDAYEKYKGEFYTTKRVFDFAKRHNLHAENGEVDSTVVISW